MATVLKLMLIGKKGQGKSSVGNTLTGRLDGRAPFRVRSGTTPATTEPSCVWSQLDQYKFLIVDTPDLEIFGTNKKTRTKLAIKKVEKILSMCNGSVNAFIYVVRFGDQITAEDVSTLVSLKLIFGITFHCNLVVLFTHGDNFISRIGNNDDVTFNQLCRSQEDCVSDLYKFCGHRFLLMNNKEINRGNDHKQRLAVLNLTQVLIPACDGFAFTAGAFFREELVKNHTADFLKEAVQQHLDLLEDNIEKILHLNRDTGVDTFSGALDPILSNSNHNEFLRKLRTLESSFRPVLKRTELEKRLLEIKEYRAQQMPWDKLTNFFNISDTGVDFKGYKILKVILMGKTGHGKSATGNTLAGRTIFLSRPNPISTTLEVDCEWAELNDYKCLIVDSPGLEDTQLNTVNNTSKAITSMEKALLLCNGGVDAFLFVIRFGTRLTGEEKSSLDLLKTIFGQNFKNNLIVVMTGGDDFQYAMREQGTPGKTFEVWCQEQTSFFKKLYDEVDGRFILINNRQADYYTQFRQRSDILTLVEKLKPQYTDVAFVASAVYRREQMRKSSNFVLREDIQQRLSLLEGRLQDVTDDMESRREACELVVETIRFLEREAIGANSQFQECIDRLNALRNLILVNFNREQLNQHLDDLRTFRKSEGFWRSIKTFLQVAGSSIQVVSDKMASFVLYLRRVFLK